MLTLETWGIITVTGFYMHLLLAFFLREALSIIMAWSSVRTYLS